MSTLYLICCSMRTGSSLLHYMLRDAGVGNAEEFLHGNNPTGDTYEEFAQRIRGGNSNANVMGWRVMWGQILNQQKHNPAVWEHTPTDELLDGVVNAVGADTIRYVYVMRRDRLRQAVSAVRAKTGTRWYCPIEEAPVHVNIPFNEMVVGRVNWFMANYLKHDQMWNDYFAERDIYPFRLVYEDMTANDNAIRATIDRIGDYIGVKVPTVDIPLRKQAGADVEAWITQYEHLSLGEQYARG